MAVDRGLLDKALNIINNVGNYGPLDATIDSYKQAADYADDARKYAELAESGVNDINTQIIKVTALADRVEKLEAEVNESFDTFTSVDVDAIQGESAEAVYNKEENKIHFTIPKGKDGTNGIDGKDGINGVNGKSAYELAVAAGYTGSLQDFNEMNTKALDKTKNLSDLANPALARTNLSVNSKAEITSLLTSKANSGANSDITSLNGLSTALTISQGGTGAKNAASARQNLGLGAVSTEAIVPISKGGTGATTQSGSQTALGIKNTQNMFLYSFFNGDTNPQIDLATSFNGQTFKRITNNGLVNKSTLAPITGRDPSIIFYKGWWLVAVTGYSPNTYDSVVWRSRDLSTWESVNIKYGTSAVTGTTLPGGQVVTDKIWAPEWVIDGDNLYLLASFRYYNDSVDKNSTTIPSFRAFYSLCSDIDALTFSSPVPLNLPISTNVIDPSIFKRVSGSTYYCLIKDENLKTIKVYSSSSFTGTFTSVGNVPFTEDAEGPCAIELPNGSVRIFADYYSTDYHCHYIDTPDFSTYGSVGKISLEGKMRHGTILNLSNFDNPTLAITHLNSIATSNVSGNPSMLVRLTTDAGGTGTGNFTINPTTSPISWKPVPGFTYYTNDTDGLVTINNLPTTYPDGSVFYLMVNSTSSNKGTIILKSGTTSNGIYNPSGADFWINPLSYQSRRPLKFISLGGLWYGEQLTYNDNFIIAAPDRSSTAIGQVAVGGQIGSRLVHSGASNGSSLVSLDARATIGTTDFACIAYRNWAGVSKTWNFEANGNATAVGGSWNNSSDERIKNDLKTVDGALDAVLSWRGATWNYKPAKDDDKDNKIFGIGLVAQDVYKTCPDAVSNLGKHSYADGTVVDDVMSLNTSGVAAAYHTEAIKELYAIIQDQAKQIKALSDKVSAG